MKIYKLFFQLLRANLVQILVSTGALLLIVIPINAAYNANYLSAFEVARSKIGILNHDANHPVTEAFIAYLDDETTIVPVGDSPEAVADALYYQKADYVLTIPEGFGASQITPGPKKLQLEKKVTQAAETEAFVDLTINKYLTNLDILAIGLDDHQSDTEVAILLKDLDHLLADAAVTIKPTDTPIDVKLLAFGQNYSSFISYVMALNFISVFGLVTVAMRDPEIIKRDRMGMLTIGERWRQLLLGCFTFSVSYWFLLMVMALVMYGFAVVFSPSGLLLVLNSFISMLGIQGLAYLIATLSPSKGAVTFFSTILSILIAFSSGIFVPRAFISPLMQQFASFATPIWQVKTTEIILESTILSAEQLGSLFELIGIQLLIAVTYFMASFIIQKYRQTHYQY